MKGQVLNMKKLTAILILLVMTLSLVVPASAVGINLAQLSGVSVYMKSVNGYELPTSGSKYATNAVDGDTETVACAANEWNWMLELDLNETYIVGTVALTFGAAPNFPTDYKISVSADNDNWIDVANVSGNNNSSRREHKFSATSARYIRVTDLKAYVGVSQMHVAEIEVYEAEEGELAMTMLSPSDGAKGVANTTSVVVSTGGEISAAYLAGFKLEGENGEVECYKKLELGNVIITPKSKLDGGKYYVTVQGRKMWSFTAANENLTRTASTKKVNMSEVELTGDYTGNFRPASYVVDGDTSTTTSSAGYYRGYWLELDFGKPYENMNYAKVTFPNTRGYGNTEIFVSNDGLKWSKVTTFPANKQQTVEVNFPPVTARYMRFRILNANDDSQTFAEIDVLSIPGDKELQAEITENTNANGNITLSFNDGIDLNTIADGVKLKKGGVSTPCAERETVEFDYIAENSCEIALVPKNGLDYGEDYIIVVTDKLKSVWGKSAKTAYKEFTVEEEKDLEITTLSSSEYMENKENSIYPAFADNMPYQSWTEDGEKDWYDIKAEGGKRPYTFSISAGKLPDGITMTEKGRLSGIPEKEGDFEFTVKVTDSVGNTVEKQLTMEVNPYRAKWYDEARFGIMNQSTYASPYIKKYGPAEGLALFEKYIDDVFYPEKWAEQLYNMGAKIFNFTAMGGDGVRKWPSKMKTTYNLAIKRNCVAELLEACHKYGIKLITYIPPDTTWTGSIELDPETGSWYPLLREAARELAQMNVDGIWCDMGMNSTEANWKEVVSVIRTENPYTLIYTNNGSIHGGVVANYPYVDIQGWEGKGVQNCPDDTRIADDIYTAFKTPVRKKMGLEATVLAGPHWGDNGGSPHGDMDFQLKPIDEYIESIQSNWDNGATFMAVYPFYPQSGGKLVHSLSKDGIDEITEWVNANIIPSNMPQASLEAGTYSGKQMLTLSGNGDIYYTTDGSIPDKTSIPYTGSIEITDSVRIRAAAYEDGKGKSLIMQKDYIIDGAADNCMKLTDGNIESETVRPKKDLMSGIKVRVGENPVELRAIGRKATGSDGKGHLLKVQRVGDKKVGPIMETEIDMSIGTADEQGYKYKEIAPVILEPFSSYIIMCEETTATTFANVKSFDNILPKGLTITEGVITDEQLLAKTALEMNGDISDKLQLLNLKYNLLAPYEDVDKRNIAFDSKVMLLDNYGKQCIPSGYNQYAENAIDNDTSTRARAGYAYAWTLHVDLKKAYTEINEIKILMDDYYATEYQIDVSLDNETWETITYVNDNHSGGEKIILMSRSRQDMYEYGR